MTDLLPPLPIIEPFRIRTIEPLKMTTLEQRQKLIEEAGWNLFALKSRHVLVDLLTDSGTGAMSTEQWGAVMRADESYAGADSYDRFAEVVQEVTGMPEAIPTHQGRAAEHLLLSTIVEPGQRVLGNTHFDTTRAHIELRGASAEDLPAPDHPDTTQGGAFKGNIDLIALESALREDAANVALIIITATNNALGGHPVSLENMQRTRELAQKFKIPLFLDAARFAENAALIKHREPGREHQTPVEIACDMFDLFDGCLMSAKKDALVNIGGFIALRDAELAAEMRQKGVFFEGFPTYGGLAGRDLEAIAQGLREVLDNDYLTYRLASVAYLAEGLDRVGLPIIRPPGGHAVFIDAGAALPHIPPHQFPGQALACALYTEGGIRGVEIGSLMFGEAAQGELLRLALPRRVYTQSHADYVIAIGARIVRRIPDIRGLEIVEQARQLRHFTAVLRPVSP
jgi:tryptophanase